MALKMGCVTNCTNLFMLSSRYRKKQTNRTSSVIAAAGQPLRIAHTSALIPDGDGSGSSPIG